MAETYCEFNIVSLPDELITIILSNNKLRCRDVLNFSATCKHFLDIVTDNACLWKNKAKVTLPGHIYEVVGDHCDSKWLNELKSYFNLKKYIVSELILMSPKFYRRDIDIHFSDVRNFFKVALSRSVNYYITVSVFVDILKVGYSYTNCNMDANHPYTFTDMYYARIILRYLFHGFLMVDWVRSSTINEPTPEKVIHFFLQWTDTMKLHLRQETEAVIQNVVSKIENFLEESHPLKKASASDKELWRARCLANNMWRPSGSRAVLFAVKHVIYQEKHMNVTPCTNLDTLDIKKAMTTRTVNATAVAALFAAAAQRCGVRCDLIAFPNHMFLEWRENYDDPNSEVFIINLGNGEVERKRRCPYSQLNIANYKYCPHSMLQYLYATFNRTMGAIRDWSTQNSFHLLDFINVNSEEHSPYRNMLAYLTQQMALNPAPLTTPLNFKYVNDVHIEMIWTLASLNKNNDVICRQVTVKKYDSSVRFAVGMICYHLKYDYVCVVRGWDAACAAAPDWQRRMNVAELEGGAAQPFYNVVAADYSERYVAQENLREVSRPIRLYHLEDMLAREFGHFDGFAYIPNEEKEAEYPQDGHLRSFFRNRGSILAP